MSDGFAGWLEANDVGAPVDYAEHGALLARRQAEAEDRRAEVAEEHERVKREEARDAQMVAYRLAGVQPGAQIQRALALQELEAEAAGHQDALAKLARRRERLLSEAADQAEAVSRSQVMLNGPRAADGVEAAAMRARAALGEAESWRRAEAAVARKERRPKGRRGGFAVRGEPVTCDACKAVGATPEESFLIHHTDADGEPLSVSPVPVPVPPDDAGRYQGAGNRDYGMAVR